jgi:hypothetical protein
MRTAAMIGTWHCRGTRAARRQRFASVAGRPGNVIWHGVPAPTGSVPASPLMAIIICRAIRPRPDRPRICGGLILTRPRRNGAAPACCSRPARSDLRGRKACGNAGRTGPAGPAGSAGPSGAQGPAGSQGPVDQPDQPRWPIAFVTSSRDRLCHFGFDYCWIRLRRGAACAPLRNRAANGWKASSPPTAERP